MIENSYLHKEIFEQPAVIADLLNSEWAAVSKLAQAIQEKNIKHIVIAARGTSDNAGRYAQYVLGARNQMVVTLSAPSLFSIYEAPPSFDNCLVLGISQSGQSPDIVGVLEEAQEQEQLTAAITNSPVSPLAKAADFVIDIHAGPEKAVAATKSYTNSLLAIAMLSEALQGLDQPSADLMRLPEAIGKTLELSSPIFESASRYRFMKHCVVIGRGFNYATAFEMALKMKELTYTIVEPYSSADFLHGPFAVIEQGFPVILLAPSGKMKQTMLELAQTLKDYAADTLILSDDGDLLELATVPVQLPVSLPEWLSPIAAILP
ncbi:MAG: SIS domain-containing protein, partial [Chloroflexota bacterium]